MQIGLTSGAPGVARTVADAQRAESGGFAAYVTPGDSTATLALIGAQTDRIRLLTAVVPIFGTHPATVAGQARAAQDASNGRFTLGVGLSHRPMVVDQMGLPFDRPAARMREYLQILVPLLRGEAVDQTGEYYSFHGEPRPSAGGDVSCAIAALAPVMLRLSGELAGGTIL